MKESSEIGLAASSKKPKISWLNRTVLGVGLASLFSDVGHEMATTAMPVLLASLGASSADSRTDRRTGRRTFQLRQIIFRPLQRSIAKAEAARGRRLFRHRLGDGELRARDPMVARVTRTRRRLARTRRAYAGAQCSSNRSDNTGNLRPRLRTGARDGQRRRDLRARACPWLDCRDRPAADVCAYHRAWHHCRAAHRFSRARKASRAAARAHALERGEGPSEGFSPIFGWRQRCGYRRFLQHAPHSVGNANIDAAYRRRPGGGAGHGLSTSATTSSIRFPAT